MRVRMLVRIASWAGVVFIASLAFWVSYHAISGVWISSGAGRRQDAWAIPLLIDGLIVVGSLVGLARALDGARGKWASAHPWVLVLCATVVSLLANIAHAAPSPGAQAMAALIPLILFAATELVVGEFRRTRTRISPAPARIVEEDDGIAPVPVTGGHPATGAGDLHGRGRLPIAPGVGVGGAAVERADGGVGHTAPTRPVGDLEGDRGRAGPGGGAVAGVRPDEPAPDRIGKMTIPEAVGYLIDVDGVDPHIKPGRIVDDVLRLTGRQVINTGSIGNALHKARQNAPSNGGMRVR